MPHRPPTVLPDFRRLFESAPGPFLVVTPDLVVMAASHAYLELIRRPREDVVGRSIDELFPDRPDEPFAIGARHLRASVARAIALRRPDEMPLLKHDVSRPGPAGGGTLERYWHSVVSPVFARDGTVACVIHHVGDITELVRLHERLRRQAAEQRRTLAALRESEERCRQLFFASPEPLWICDRATLRFLAVNDAAVRLYGYSLEEFARMTLRDMRPAGDLAALIEHLVGAPAALGATRTWHHVARDGRVIDVELSTEPIRFAGRAAVLVRARELPPRVG